MNSNPNRPAENRSRPVNQTANHPASQQAGHTVTPRHASQTASRPAAQQAGRTVTPRHASQSASRPAAQQTSRKTQATVHRKRRMSRRQRRQRMIFRIAGAAVAVILAIILIFALGGGKDRIFAPKPTATPTAAPTAEPTATPEPTAVPTATPEPTATPAPTTPPEFKLYTSGGVQLTEASAEGRMPYQIYVSKDSFTIAILGIDENGDYTRLLRTWRTAIGTGNKTRAGSYTIDKQWLWYEWADGGYTPFTSHLEGTKMRLHAPLHNKNEDWNSLWRNGYREIGSKETQGCLRTTSEGAAWVYFNCAVGTEVRIANDELYQSEEPPELGDSKSDPTRPHSPADVEIPAAFFTVDESVTLSAGQTHQLTIGNIMPAYEGAEFSFAYYSANEGVVTVKDGVLTAVAPGSAQVLVMADDVNKAYRILTVTVV